MHYSYRYYTHWLAIGGSYNPLNNQYGLEISNAYDESSLIHFEDHQDDFLAKLSFQSDFKSDFSYHGEFGWKYLYNKFISRLTVGYLRRKMSSFSFLNTETYVTFNGHIPNLINLTFRMGYQKLNGLENFGLNIGTKKRLGHDLHIGGSSGYYKDYFQHRLYLLYLVRSDDISTHHNILSHKISYEYINRFNFLTFTVAKPFVRNKNR